MIIKLKDRRGRTQYATGTDLIIEFFSVVFGFLIVFGGLFLLLSFLT